MTDDTTVTHDPEGRRYELRLDGEPAGELGYRPRGEDVVAFVHTEVRPELQRAGLGSTLVRFALDDARARGLKVVPVCPFVDAFIRRHREYAELVAG